MQPRRKLQIHPRLSTKTGFIINFKKKKKKWLMKLLRLKNIVTFSITRRLNPYGWHGAL